MSRFYACALLLTLSASAATIPDLQITPLPIGSPPTFTTSAVAPDPENPDVFWFTDLAFQQIGSLNRRTGAVVQHSLRPPNGDTIQPGAAQQALAFGADGNLWFGAVRNIATAPQSVIGRFDRATGALAYFPIPNAGACLAATGCHVVLGPDGHIWFTEPFSGFLGRITPDGAITEVPIVEEGGAPADTVKGIAVGSDGNFWLPSGTRNLFRVQPTGAAKAFRLTGGSFRRPYGITAASDGNVYFTEAGNSADGGNRIGRITPSGEITEWPIPTADSNAVAIAAGADGKLYFVEQAARQIGRLDPAMGVIEESPIPNGGIPTAIVSLPSETVPSDQANVSFVFLTLDQALTHVQPQIGEIAKNVPLCPTRIQPETLPNAVENEYYFTMLTRVGGNTPCPCTWTATGLPAGMTLDSDQEVGILQGIPDFFGAYDLVIEVVDSAGCRTRANYRLTVRPQFLDLKVTKTFQLFAAELEVGAIVEYEMEVASVNERQAEFELIDELPAALQVTDIEPGCTRITVLRCKGTSPAAFRVRAVVKSLDSPIVNCARIVVPGDVNGSNDRDCVSLTGPKRRAVRR